MHASGWSVAEFVERYAETHDLKPGSVEQLAIAARSYEAFQGGRAEWSEVCDEKVNGWLAHLQGSGLKPVTVSAKRRALLTLWRAAHDENLVDRPPYKVKRIKCPERVPIAFLLSELKQLRDAAAGLEGDYPKIGIPKAIWWLSFLDFKYDTALRLGDVLSIERKDIWPGGRVSIVQSKTGHSHSVRLRPRTIEEIDECMSYGRTRAIIWPIWCRYNTWFQHFNEVRLAAGLKAGTSKWIRRASASYVERDNPGCGSRHLGHRSPGLAVKHYFDPRIVGRDPVLPPEI